MSDFSEMEAFRSQWTSETEKTLRLLEALPRDQYDFRPDPEGRSIGELAWHLAEIDGCLSFGVAKGYFSYDDPVPDLKRPRQIAELASGYRRVHEQAVARLENLEDERLDGHVTFADGRPMTIRDVLWTELLHHLVHHRGQLALMCRMARGTPPGLYGPNREEMQQMMAKMEPAKS